MIELLLQQSNLYLQQNEKNFLTNAAKMQAFIGLNYIMVVSQLPNIPMYWDCNHFVDNSGTQNIFTRTRFQVLQNLHFADNTEQEKADKGCKIRPIIDHLN